MAGPLDSLEERAAAPAVMGKDDMPGLGLPGRPETLGGAAQALTRWNHGRKECPRLERMELLINELSW